MHFNKQVRTKTYSLGRRGWLLGCIHFIFGFKSYNTTGKILYSTYNVTWRRFRVTIFVVEKQ